jgi:hypothetical protein
MKLNKSHYEWYCELDNKTLSEFTKEDVVGREMSLVYAKLYAKAWEKEEMTYEQCYRHVSRYLPGTVADNERLTLDLYKGLLANILFHLNNMKISGDQIFHISNDLKYMLNNTDVDIDCRLVKPPFDSFYLAFEDPTYYDGSGWVNGMYIHNKEGLLRVMVVIGKNPNDMSISNVSYTYSKIEYDESTGENFSDILEKWYKSSEFEDMENGDNLKKLVKLAINFMLYISGSNYDKIEVKASKVSKASPKSIRKKKNKRKNNSRKTTAIGFSGNYSLDRVDGSGSSGSRQKRHIVRGHWRKQAYGVGYSKRKPVFIKAFIKGTELSESLGRIYEVD